MSEIEITGQHEREVMTRAAARDVAGARRETRRRLRLVFVVIALAICFLLYKTLSGAVTYFKTVDQALSSRIELGNADFQLEGVVVAHSITRPNATTVDFVIRGTRHQQISVTNSGEPPELFQADIPVVLVGHFVGASDRFQSDEILVKHSNSYIAAHPKRVRAPNGSVR
ncbi:MAG TPA: cytochrome c maturation protein CcmE [Acidimicrobiales bacterium]|nr:cytochrome c maturation protein CcmE [Acidimicrobiales bacterium]